MRADPTNSSDDGSALHEEGEVERTFFLRWQEAEALRRVADANESSTCGEKIDQGHLPTASIREGRAFAQQAKAEAKDGGRHSLDGHDLLWPLMPSTVHAEHIADNPF